MLAGAFVSTGYWQTPRAALSLRARPGRKAECPLFSGTSGAPLLLLGVRLVLRPEVFHVASQDAGV